MIHNILDITIKPNLPLEETRPIIETDQSDNNENITDENTEDLELDFEYARDIIETERNGKDDQVGIQIRRRKKNDKVETKFYTFG